MKKKVYRYIINLVDKMRKTGIIYSVDLDARIISLKNVSSLDFYYIGLNLMKKFKKYLYVGNLISFEYDNSNKEKKSNKYLAYTINYFYELSVPGRYGKDILYSKEETTKELREFLNSLDYTMFLDIEMSMPGYDRKPFTPEMIQAGFIVVDKKDNIILKSNYYIKLTKNNFLSKRTTSFLNIDYETLEAKGISYDEFYNIYKDILDKYNPSVIVFGKNDKKYLESSFKVNNKESLNNRTRFININQLIKTYYEIPNDPGLFNMYEKMYGNHNVQKHDALEDAIYTYYVFKAFKKDVNKLLVK